LCVVFVKFSMSKQQYKKEFCKIFKAKICFVASSVWFGDDTLSKFGNDIHSMVFPFTNYLCVCDICSQALLLSQLL
jgi:hypothetical protein